MFQKYAIVFLKIFHNFLYLFLYKVMILILIFPIIFFSNFPVLAAAFPQILYRMRACGKLFDLNYLKFFEASVLVTALPQILYLIRTRGKLFVWILDPFQIILRFAPLLSSCFLFLGKFRRNFITFWIYFKKSSKYIQYHFIILEQLTRFISMHPFMLFLL